MRFPLHFLLCHVIFSIMLLSSCSPQQNRGSSSSPMSRNGAPASTTYYYECSSGEKIPVNIKNDAAWVFLPYRTIRLPHVPAASGAKYSDGTNTYWSKGEEASIVMGQDEYLNCSNNHQLAIWEHAKLTGVDFRAVGNEPGWVLELYPDRIEYKGDYGQTQQTFSRPQAERSSSAQQTVYHAGNASATMTILLEPRTCYDTMSGEKFSTTVIIRQETMRLVGCGRPLH